MIHTGRPAAAPIRHARLARLIQRRPLSAFFTLAYLGSWILWLPYVFGPDGLNLEPDPIPELLGSTELVGILPGAYAGPLGAAFLVTLVAGGKPALLTWRHRLNRWRVGPRWYLVALVGTPALLLAGALVLPGVAADWQPPTGQILLAYLLMLPVQILTSGLAEEPGWRDFALPVMQYRYGPVPGTLLLGGGWAIWHYPLFTTQWSFMGDRIGTPQWFGIIAVFTAMCLPVSIFITWVFNNTDQSLPLAMILHAGINNMASVLLVAILPGLPTDWGLLPPLIGFTAAAAVVLLATRGRLGYRRPRLSPELARSSQDPGNRCTNAAAAA